MYSTIRKAVVLVAIAATPALAQFTPDRTDIGPTIGLGGIGEAGLSIGGRFEKGIKVLPSLNNGVLGIMVSMEYYSWSVPGFDWTYIPIGATANYHFQIENTKLDPFVGAGLGFQIITCDWDGVGVDICDNSGIFFIGRAGARYFWKPNMALYADVGAGAALLNIGLMFKLKGS